MSTITSVRTIRIPERANLIWVELETDEGLVGLGESFRGAPAVEAAIHDQVAPWLLGRDSRRIEAISRYLTTPYIGFHSAAPRSGRPAPSTSRCGTWRASATASPSTRRWAAPRAPRSAPTTPAPATRYNTAGVGRRGVAAGEATQGPVRRPGRVHADAGALAQSLIAEGTRQ